MMKRYMFAAVVGAFSGVCGMEKEPAKPEYVEDARQLSKEKGLYFSLLPKDVLGIVQLYRLHELLDRVLEAKKYSENLTGIKRLAQLPEYTQVFSNPKFSDDIIYRVSSKFGAGLEEVARNINTIGSRLWLQVIWPNQVKLLNAALAGDLSTVQQLIAQGVNVNAQNRYSRTALMEAAWRGRTEIVKELIKAAANLNAQTDDGRTALMWATINGHTALMKILIDAGADVNARSNTGRTALMCAADYGRAEIVKILIGSGVDVTAQNKGKQTALDIAREYDCKEIIELLKKAAKK